MVRRHKKIRPPSWILAAILDFFTLKWHIFDFRAIKYLFMNIFPSYFTKVIPTICVNDLSNQNYIWYTSFLSQVQETYKNCDFFRYLWCAAKVNSLHHQYGHYFARFYWMENCSHVSLFIWHPIFKSNTDITLDISFFVILPPDARHSKEIPKIACRQI